MKVQKYKTSCPLETYEQQAFVTYGKELLTYSGFDERLLFAIPNAGKRDVKNASRMKAEGLTKGIPDTMLAISRKGFHGLFIEMKRVKGSETSPDQIEVIAELKKQGYSCHICKGCNEAQKVLDWYLSN